MEIIAGLFGWVIFRLLTYAMSLAFGGKGNLENTLAVLGIPSITYALPVSLLGLIGLITVYIHYDTKGSTWWKSFCVTYDLT